MSGVYLLNETSIEYLKYIKYLQSKKYLGKVEKLEIEDLQGVSGLKAIRVEVIYDENYNNETSISFDDLIQELKV